MTQNNLGNALAILGERETGTESRRGGAGLSVGAAEYQRDRSRRLGDDAQ